MTGVDVENTKALEAAATQGPWEADQRNPSAEWDVYAPTADSGERVGNLGAFIGHSWEQEDAEFIAHARTAVPALVAAVERVQAIAEHWSTCPKSAYDCNDCNYNVNEAGHLLLEALETP